MERKPFDDFPNPGKAGQCFGEQLLPELRIIYAQVLENKNDLKWVKGLLGAFGGASIVTLLTLLASLVIGG